MKRKAEDSDSESARPCKVLKIRGGRRVVLDSEDEDAACCPKLPRSLVSAPRKRGQEGDDKEGNGDSPHKRFKAAVLAKKRQPSLASTYEKRVSPKADDKVSKPLVPQQKAPKRPSLSFFGHLNRRGEKPIQPREWQIRKETVTKSAPPKSATSTVNRPAATKPDATKTATPRGSSRLLPKNGGFFRVPKRTTTPAAALSKATQSASAAKATESPAMKKLAPAKAAGGPADEGEVADRVRSTAPEALALAEGVPPSLPKKRKAEEPAAAPAAKKSASGTKPSSWLFTGKLPGSKNGNTSAKAEHSQAGREGAQQGSNEQDSSIDSKPIDGSQQKTKETAVNGQDQSASPGKRSADLENYGTACFANVMFQALHSVPEIREHLVGIMRFRLGHRMDTLTRLTSVYMSSGWKEIVVNGARVMGSPGWVAEMLLTQSVSVFESTKFDRAYCGLGTIVYAYLINLWVF
ncbi:MAG: hypothetical protein Q9173_002608 [Seirophora scorigena]